MITQTPEQQRLYEARLKFQLDEAARLELANTQGLIQGRTEGRIEARREGVLDKIATLQELLGIVEPTPAELLNRTDSQLLELVEQLKLQISRSRQQDRRD